MNVALVALYYPHREHWDEMISRVRRPGPVLERGSAVVSACRLRRDA